jgi:vacuolar-type H+-ATPase subunit F/Vma7
LGARCCAATLPLQSGKKSLEAFVMTSDTNPTRMIALGAAPLMEGFALIGFETHSNASAEQLETLLEQLVRNNTRALVLLEAGLARSTGPWLNRVRSEGGNIVVTEVPALHQAQEYHPQVEDLVTSILGDSALEELNSGAMKELP